MSISAGRDVNVQTGDKSKMEIDNSKQKGDKETALKKIVIGVIVGILVAIIIVYLNKYFGVNLK